MGPVGPGALVLLILQFWLTLLAVLVILAIQLSAIQHLSHLPSFVSLFQLFKVGQILLKIMPSLIEFVTTLNPTFVDLWAFFIIIWPSHN